MSPAKLNNARLMGARFSRADMSMSILCDADLSGSSFDESKALCADLSNANMSGCRFNNSDLRGAKLSNATLTNTRFSIFVSDDFVSANKVHAADFGSAIGMTQDTIETMWGDASTRLPAGLTRPEFWLENDRYSLPPREASEAAAPTSTSSAEHSSQPAG